MTRRLIVFRDEGHRIGEPDEICGALFFDDRGNIEAHLDTSSVYAFAYLVGPDLDERLIGRRCSHDPLDPAAMMGRVLGGEEKIEEGLEADQRAWKRYDRELDRESMAQEILSDAMKARRQP